MLLRWSLNYLLFLLVAFGGAFIADQLVGLIAPGDVCEGLLLTVTVGFLTTLFLVAIVYLRIAVIAMLHERWPEWMQGRLWWHAVGAGTLVFSISTPFIFLAGPQSSLAYGERVIVTEALSRSVPLQRALERYWLAAHQLPQSMDDLDTVWKQDQSPSVLEKVALSDDGSLRLELRSTRYPRLEGRHIHLKPLIDNGVLMGWDCRGGDVPASVRPLRCRATSVCSVLGY